MSKKNLKLIGAIFKICLRMKVLREQNEKKSAKLLEIQKELIQIKKHNDSHKIYF